jgi:transposase
LYYDVTTIYFESFTEDELKRLGFSKDNKFNQPQLVLTMLVSDKRLPLGYQLLPGNTYEGNTLTTAIKSWREQYPAQKKPNLIVVH